MSKHNDYFHWIYGENRLRDDKPNYLINLEIGISIRFDDSLAYFSDYDTFYNSIADVQFFMNTRPGEERLEEILTEAWNFMVLEDRQLEEDCENMEDEEDY